MVSRAGGTGKDRKQDSSTHSSVGKSYKYLNIAMVTLVLRNRRLLWDIHFIKMVVGRIGRARVRG